MRRGSVDHYRPFGADERHSRPLLGGCSADRPDEALQWAEQAPSLSRERGERGHEGWALRLLGEIASHRDVLRIEEAEARYRQGSVLARELGMLPLVAHCELGLGKLYGRTGRAQDAQERLTTALTMCREMESNSGWRRSSGS